MATNYGETDETYNPNATDPNRVVAFDTDMTMDYAGGPVPLEHVIELRDDPNILVWSTGYNQTLRDEADIPGMTELKDMRNLDIGFVDRPDRMRLLERQYPNADRYDVVDDVDLRELEAEGWHYYQPIEYTVEVLGITPSRLREEYGFDTSDYLARVGSFGSQLPSSVIDLTTDKPYSERTRTGVQTPAKRNSTQPIREERFRDGDNDSLFGDIRDAVREGLNERE